jgi:hypothetical protein
LRQIALDKECALVGDSELHCEFWNEVGILYSSGRFVKIRAAANGKVEHVSVTSITRLFGLTIDRPNNGFQPTPSARLN